METHSEEGETIIAQLSSKSKFKSDMLFIWERVLPGVHVERWKTRMLAGNPQERRL